MVWKCFFVHFSAKGFLSLQLTQVPVSATPKIKTGTIKDPSGEITQVMIMAKDTIPTVMLTGADALPFLTMRRSYECTIRLEDAILKESGILRAGQAEEKWLTVSKQESASANSNIFSLENLLKPPSYKECVDIVDMYNKGEEPEHNVAAASLQQADKAGIAGSMLVSRRGRTMRGQAHH